MKWDEWLRCGQRDVSTRLWRRHHSDHGTEMETPWQGLAINQAMAHTLALPSQPVTNLSLLMQRAQSQLPAPVQTSPSRYPLWCFRWNRVEKSPWPHPCRSSPFTGLYLGDYWLYQLQSMTPRCVFEWTIQPIHLNVSIRHKVLEAAGATPFSRSFQGIKLPSLMMSYANYDILQSCTLICNWSNSNSSTFWCHFAQQLPHWNAILPSIWARS